MQAEGYVENWITYRSPGLQRQGTHRTPGRTVTIKDGGAYGMILLQGHGKMGVVGHRHPGAHPLRPAHHGRVLRNRRRGAAGVTISNPSQTDPIVMLKHFGPENPDLKK